METDTERRGTLILFPKTKEEPVSSTSFCHLCKSLELDYERAVDEIRLLMNTRFPTVGEKVCRLHQCQAVRDVALRAFYEHDFSVYGPSFAFLKRTGNSASIITTRTLCSVESGGNTRRFGSFPSYIQ